MKNETSSEEKLYYVFCSKNTYKISVWEKIKYVWQSVADLAGGDRGDRPP